MQFEPLRIFHEHQSSQLCARHCLNNLLQGPYFTEFDLSQIALALDKEEQALLAQDGNDGLVEWLKHNKQSQNVSDDGNFSIQVLRRALDNLSLKIYHFGNKDITDAQQHPEHEHGFICNLQAHWFAIRRIGGQWYNLNSLSGLPETTAIPTTISNFYLSAFLSTLTNDGYSIFVVRSDNWPHLHAYDAQQLLPPYAKWYMQSEIKARGDTYPKHLLQQVNKSRNGQHVTSLGWGGTRNNEDMLQYALQQSVNDTDRNSFGMEQDPELAHALALSMQNNNNNNNNNNGNSDHRKDMNVEEDEDVLLQKALAMSMMDTEDNNEDNDKNKDEGRGMDMDVVNEDKKVEVVEEPDESDEDCATIVLRLPQNKRVERRFKLEHTLRDVSAFVKVQDASFDDIVFVCPPMHSYHDKDMTLDVICKELNSKKLSFIVKENANKD